jgi:uncharacterized protein
MIIKYTNFSDGIHQFRLTEPVAKLGLENLFFGDVNVDCKMDKSPHQIVLFCETAARTKFICDRCTVEFEAELKSKFQISYIFTRKESSEEDFNVRYLSPLEDKIILDKDVFEYAELSIPMKKLCSDDCNGLCSKCGINLNEKNCGCKPEIDNDIWAPLQKLKNK